MIQEAPQVDIVSYNTLLKGYAQRNDIIKAHQARSSHVESEGRPSRLNGPSWHSEQPGTARKWVFLVNLKTLWDWDYVWYCIMMYYVIYWLTSWRGFSGIQSLWLTVVQVFQSLLLRDLKTGTKNRHVEPPRHSHRQWPTKWGPRSIAKLVYNSNNYGLWYL